MRFRELFILQICRINVEVGVEVEVIVGIIMIGLDRVGVGAIKEAVVSIGGVNLSIKGLLSVKKEAGRRTQRTTLKNYLSTS